MKTKHLFLSAAISVPVFALLRILQHIFIIDKNGCYTAAGMPQKLFAQSLYLLAALAAVLAAVHIFTSKKTRIDPAVFTCIPATGLLFVLIAAAQLFESGYSIGAMMSGGAFSAVPVLCLLSAVFFALYGMTVLTGKKPNAALSLFGIFPPIYVASVGIETFFQSFESANVSYLKFKMLTVCAMALMLFCISASLSGVKVTMRRYAAVVLLFTAFASVSSVGELYTLFTSSMPTDDILFIVQQIILIPVALITLRRARELPDEPVQADASEEYDEAMDMYSKMNIYIDDIKEEKDTEPDE